jgi:heat shock protein HslJ
MRLSKSVRPGRHAFVIMVALLSITAVMHEAMASGPGFPFDHELRFDGNPVRGSKRVPGLQITKTGAAEIDLWCASGKGQAVIIDNQITIIPLSLQDNQCPADRLRMDEDLLNSLTAVTTWRWDGQTLVLVGPRPLRFRPASN